MTKKAYGYMRASTNPKLQKNSIEIQKSVISKFAQTHGYEIVDYFIEYKSGADDSRVMFNKWLNTCVSENAVAISWKIDRMSRSLGVFKKIQNHLHLLRFCELGDQEPSLLTLSVLLGVAHQERINTSTRVKATYEALKAKDPNHPWGNPNMGTEVQPLGEAVRVRNASHFNAHIQSICTDFQNAGYCGLRELAVKLNQVGLRTRRGSEFNHKNLQRILAYGRSNA
jgi:hypothetical protein